MELFRGKRVLITGGSSGIGLAAARLLRQAGAHLVLVARDLGRLQEAAKGLRAVGSGDLELTVVALDVGDGPAVCAAAEAGKLSPGAAPLDVLINNAGVVMPGHFLDLPPEQFEEMMQINFMGAVHMTRALLPPMLERGRGNIAFVSSLAGLMGIYGYTAYAASKFAVRGFAEALRCELRPRGISVTVCYPPDTDTPQLAFEERFKPAETKAIAGNVKALPASLVAEKLLGGIAGGRFHVVPGSSARFADIGYRLLPSMVRSMFDSDVRKARARSDGQTGARDA